jgi:uncharacterized repeat protein (TIGR01451 family)
VTVTDTLPTGLTANSMSGTGWTCTVAPATCTRSDSLAPQSSYPAITLGVSVAGNSPLNVTNRADVSGGGDTNTSNNTAYDQTTISPSTCGSLATMLTPVPNSTLSGSTATFTWNQSCTATQYYLYVGSTSGGNDIISVSTAANLSQIVTGLPTDGRTIYVRLWSYLSNWLYNDYTYTAYHGVGAPQLSIAKSHSGNFMQGQIGTYTITVINATGAGPAPAGAIQVVDNLPAGLTASAMSGSGWNCTPPSCTSTTQLNAGSSLPLTLTVNVANNAPSSVGNTANLFLNGSTIGSQTDTTTIVPPCINGAATMVAPVPGSTLSGSTVTFTWNASCNATDYALVIGTGGIGTYDVLVQIVAGTSQTVSNLPTSGTIYVRLWSNISGSWLWNDYQYTIGTAAGSYWIFGNLTPAIPWYDDTTPLTLGVKFRSDQSGYVTAIRFFKGDARNNSTHTGLLYNASTGVELGRAVFTETATGWQQVNLPTPVFISANTTYIAAFFTTTGYALTANAFVNGPVDSPPLHALQSNSTNGNNGVCAVGYSVPQFPTACNTYNYWVDIVFTPQSGTVPITVTSSPAGRSLTVDGNACSAPCTYQWTPGTSHPIAATTPQAGGTGVQYVFANWSDNGAPSHSVTPTVATTYTATFTTQYSLTTAVGTGGGGTITPSPGISWWNSGSGVTVTATANTGFQFTGFTGTTNSSANPLTFTITGPTSETATFSAMPTAAVPTITPGTGNYSGTQMVTISTTTAGASIGYTTDGSTPTEASTLYASAISVTSTTTIKAIAYKTGWLDSSVASATLNITPPSFTIDILDGAQTVTSNTPVTLTIPGTSVTYPLMIRATAVGNYSGTINFNVFSNFPTGVSPTTGASPITLNGSGSALGSFPLTVYSYAHAGYYTASFNAFDGKGLSQTVYVYLSVITGPPPALSTTCSASPNPATVSQLVTFMAFPTGGTPPYSYSWTGASGAGQGASFSSSTPVIHNAQVTVTDSASPTHHTVSANCSVSVNNWSPASMVSPIPGTVLTGGGTTTFSWNSGTGASQYQLTLGSTPGAADLGSVSTGSSQSASMTLPSGNPPVTIWATVGSLFGTTWWYRYYSYRVAANPSSPGSNHIIIPPPTMGSDSAHFVSGGSNSGYYVLDDGSGGATGCCRYAVEYGSSVGIQCTTDDSLLFINGISAPAPNQEVLNYFDVGYGATRGVRTGGHTLSCNWQGNNSSLANAVTVYDATPQITDVAPDAVSPGTPPAIVSAGGQITISGYNFGQSGTVKLCVLGGGSCSPPITPNSWTHGTVDQATATLINVSPGQYTVQIESTGSQGAGFLASDTSSADSNTWEVDVASCSPTVQITSRPIFISPSISTPGRYNAALTSLADPPGGTYVWSTNNPSMVGFSPDTPWSGPSADHVTLVILSPGKATITLKYVSPCGVDVSDSFTFTVTNDTTVVAWVDASKVPLDLPPLGASDPVVQQLSGFANCGITLLSWVQFGKNNRGIADNGFTFAERVFANEFLIGGTGNTSPLQQTQNPNDPSFVSGQHYRFHERFQSYYEVLPDGRIGTPHNLQRAFDDGVSPEPCTGFQLFSLPVQDNADDGVYAFTADRSLVYLIKENRLGEDGQAVNQFLNGPSGQDFRTATPWIWAVIQFSPDGTNRPWTQGDNLQIFPSYQIYTDGVPSQALSQGDLMTFIGLNATSVYRKPQ